MGLMEDWLRTSNQIIKSNNRLISSKQTHTVLRWMYYYFNLPRHSKLTRWYWMFL